MPHPRQLSFPLNKAEYISALYSTLAAIGHEAAVQGQYSKVIPPTVEQKLMHLNQIMRWMSGDTPFLGTFDRIQIDDEGGIQILPAPPDAKPVVNRWLESRADDIKTSPYHKLPTRSREND